MRRLARRIGWTLAALLALTSGASAGACRLALVLALDVSSSVDEEEYLLQREGLARALVDPAVARLFLAGDPVALHVFEWASPSMQDALLHGWVMVEDEDDLARVATALLNRARSEQRDQQRSTAVGSALIHASEELAAAPACAARTIDVSGDGRNNVGFGPRWVYANNPFDGVTVNALVVDERSPVNRLLGAEDDLTLWFQSNVLHGRDAFWVLADGYEDFQRAMTAKLLRELVTPTVSGRPKGDDAG